MKGMLCSAAVVTAVMQGAAPAAWASCVVGGQKNVHEGLANAKALQRCVVFDQETAFVVMCAIHSVAGVWSYGGSRNKVPRQFPLPMCRICAYITPAPV